MTLQQEKNTKSLDNLSAVKKLELYPTYIYSTSNTNELCHPKIEKCLHHAADWLNQGPGFQEAEEADAEILFLREPSTHTQTLLT